ncbi:Hypothetical protein HDN1F_11910 [gamma proteobacterium HdN1]|nr:Hypothetical protein HDN1F_11910 [gamma proteobacterium HdN1]
MCGGISAALGQGLAPAGQAPAIRNDALRRLLYSILYSSGRVGSYMVAGFLVASAGEGFRQLFDATGQWLLRGLAGVMMVLVGLYLAQWWHGLVYIERAGGRLWRAISPLTRRFLPVRNPFQALALGALWGWLPCGLVYSALSWSVTAPSPLMGALVMGLFGLGTMPAMVGVGFFSSNVQRFLGRPSLRWVGGSLLILFGLWTLASPLMGHGGAHSHGATHTQEMQHEHAMQHGAMQHDAMQHDAMQHDAMQHDAMQHDTMQHDTMQHDTMQHDTMQHDTMHEHAMPHQPITPTPAPSNRDSDTELHQHHH